MLTKLAKSRVRKTVLMRVAAALIVGIVTFALLAPCAFAQQPQTNPSQTAAEANTH